MSTTLPKIARNKAEFDAALFTSTGTYDGFIVRKLKNGIKLWMAGNETYVLNADNVFCYATKQPDGGTWYSYGGRINNLGCVATHELAQIVRSLV